VKKPKGEIWFLASVVEAYNYLLKTGATRYITDCWEGLHMTSPQYVLDCIDEYISTHNAAPGTAR
jgi:hypothetical protein